MKELVILVGLPGSGKTSFYRSHLESTHLHVSKDLMGHARDKGRRQLEEVGRALRAGRSVAVDNVNARAEDRAPLIALGKELGARVVAYALQTPVKESLARNRSREGRARVPEVAVFVASKRMQPPTPGEGLDAVYRVEAEGGRFEVAPLG
ncbi:MAG TPA: AAA family ATPase [Vicinamibacteria bacterium]|nr:AAA family ATPase [Vicinamibacteria bacterium]